MDIKQKCINTLRLLSVEQIEKASSGHPGIALGAAPIMFTLYNSVMNYNAKNPNFVNRDRFVLSAGHGSALLYSTLHMFGFNVATSDLKQFRRLAGITAGHPEYRLTEGVEASTGPLGQGISNAVGMAIASKHLASTFNTKEHEIINNKIYCLASDGCFMEGVANEAMSMAGNLALDNLVVIYDSNNITLEGKSELSFSEDTSKKYQAMGFNVLEVSDAEDLEDLEQKLLLAKKEDKKPSLVIVKTKIGYGSHLEGSHLSHGKPLSKSDISTLKNNLNFEHRPFEVDEDVMKFVALKQKQNEKYENNWNNLLKDYENNNLSLFEQFKKSFSNDYKEKCVEALRKFKLEDENLAMRDIGQRVLEELKILLPNLIGGTADVSPSTKAYLKDLGSFSKKNYSGKNLHYGVREHAMAGIANGILLFGGLNTFVSTYVAFTDYMKASMRMSAIMKLPVLYFLTHDSVLIGEDGATHQPVEQLISLRATPNTKVFRPCNLSEVLAAFITHLEGNEPTVLVLAKQKINAVKSAVKDALKGGYIISEEKGKLDLILIATGSEVEISLKAKEQLEKLGINTRVVSMPSIEVFEAQEERYKNKILPKRVTKRIAVEAGSSYSFYKYIGSEGKVIGVNGFGGSGTSEELRQAFNLTPDYIVEVAQKMLAKKVK
jgi:transketolase